MTGRITPSIGQPLKTLSSSVHPLLNALTHFVLPLLKAKDIVTCSATCKEWRQITIPGDLSQRLWTILCHRDFPNSYLQPGICQALAYYVAHRNGYTLKLQGPKTDEIFGDSERATSIFSADEKLLVGYKNGAVKLWNLETKECEKTFKQTGEIRTCFFNKDYLVVGLSNGNIVGWCIETNESIDFDHHHNGAVVGFGESEKYFLSMSCKGEVILWDPNHFFYIDKTQEWARLNLFKLPFSSIKTSLIFCQKLVAFSHTSKAYALNGFDQKKLKLFVEEDVQTACTYSIDGQSVSYFADGTLRFFDSKSKSSAMTAQQGICSIYSLSFADTRFILNSIKGEEIQILDFKHFQRICDSPETRSEDLFIPRQENSFPH